jgi:integrase
VIGCNHLARQESKEYHEHENRSQTHLHLPAFVFAIDIALGLVSFFTGGFYNSTVFLLQGVGLASILILGAGFVPTVANIATRLLNAGMDITRIQKLLGHEQISTTLIYARVHDATVEADYRHAMRQIERQQLPLSNTPVPVPDWPIAATAERVEIFEELPLDNAV